MIDTLLCNYAPFAEGENGAARGMLGCRLIADDIGWNFNASWFLRSTKRGGTK